MGFDMFDTLDFMPEKADGHVERIATVMIGRVGIVIGNIGLTFATLRCLGSADVPYPANRTAKDLYGELPGESEKDMDHSVACAMEQGLPKGNPIEEDGLWATLSLPLVFFGGLRPPEENAPFTGKTTATTRCREWRKQGRIRLPRFSRKPQPVLWKRLWDGLIHRNGKAFFVQEINGFRPLQKGI